MPQTARSYLLDRFRTDALALRQRADSMIARSPTPVPGPDAAMSRRMATACERVVAMLEAVPDADDSARAMTTLLALVPLLEQHAAQESGAPPVRAVYIGAATRIREVQAAESKAAESRTEPDSESVGVANELDGDVGDGDDDFEDDDDGEHGANGERHTEADDDDVDDDDLHEHVGDDAPDVPSHPPRGHRT